MRELRGSLDGQRLAVGLAVSRYNESVTRGLLDGALAALGECEVPGESITVVHVAGALELPLAARELAHSGLVDAVVVLGAVIRGETDHYEHVCAEATRGCGQVALDTGIPIGFGLLTCETLSQARERSSTPAKNKGGEAARTAVETANLLEQLRDEELGEADSQPGSAEAER